jgi:hypothetical protein
MTSVASARSNGGLRMGSTICSREPPRTSAHLATARSPSYHLDEMIAAAVLDRLLHHSHTLVIQGDSYRLKQKKRAGVLGSSQT